jgi:hypothetical protein
MVTVAQSVELWIVAPAVVGSSPIGHPSSQIPLFFCVTKPIVCPLRTDYASKSARTNYASRYCLLMLIWYCLLTLIVYFVNSGTSVLWLQKVFSVKSSQ